MAAAPPSMRRTLLTTSGADGGPSAILLAAGHPRGALLESMMRSVPQLWQQESELPLLQRLLHAAMARPCEECVVLLMRACTPLQRRLLQLLRLCVREQRHSLLPLICVHAEVRSFS